MLVLMQIEPPGHAVASQKDFSASAGLFLAKDLLISALARTFGLGLACAWVFPRGHVRHLFRKNRVEWVSRRGYWFWVKGICVGVLSHQPLELNVALCCLKHQAMQKWCCVKIQSQTDKVLQALARKLPQLKPQYCLIPQRACVPMRLPAVRV